MFDRNYAPSSADIDACTESALTTLAWSTPTGCLHRSGVNAVCYACAPDCECIVCDRDAEQLPEFLDGTGADWEDDARATMRGIVADFLTPDRDDDADNERHADALHGLTYEQIGHDLILTANRHGAGFWDRGRGERGAYLTEQAHAVGSIGAYLTDARTLALDF
ncbi:hypothetical protein [Agromyces larvae]|uniref:Uncharacterized protein n=1 Tax=Agromyces larvae TaxID=2929802 RepID=A0ABY4C416_9MICO|nr:hypothetical protein [Agromyces larvae]UOE45954.1 hypothetical protein MTO99_09495 [Agromyces larvae]